jgi:hypothetical protein
MQNLNDLLTIGIPYGSTTLIGIIFHIYNTFNIWRERNSKREQERWKYLASHSYKDVQDARIEVPARDKTTGFIQGSFIGWTRRLLAWVVIILFIAFIVGELDHYPVNLVYKVPHKLFGWEWTSYIVKTVQGVVMSPYIREYCDIVLGFYMGHFTIKSFKS